MSSRVQVLKAGVAVSPLASTVLSISDGFLLHVAGQTEHVRSLSFALLPPLLAAVTQLVVLPFPATPGPHLQKMLPRAYHSLCHSIAPRSWCVGWSEWEIGAAGCWSSYCFLKMLPATVTDSMEL